MSRWLVGSSSSSRSGSPASARASEARVSSPPENVASERSRSLVAEAEAVQRRVDALAPAVAAGVLEPRLGGRVGVERGGVGGALGHRGLELGEPLLDRQQLLGAGQHVVAQREVALARRPLVVQRDPGALREHQLAAVDRGLARQHPQQRGLARAVAPGQRHALPALEPEGDAPQERLARHVLGEVGGDDDGHAIRVRRAIYSVGMRRALHTPAADRVPVRARRAGAMAAARTTAARGCTARRTTRSSPTPASSSSPRSRLLIFLLSMIMWLLDSRKDQPQEGCQGAPRPRRPARRLVVPGPRWSATSAPAPPPSLTIDRPERRNAIDGPTAEALHDAFRSFAADDGARVLVVTGAGEEAFCAGADLKALDTLGGRLDAPEGPLGFTRLAAPKPTIAAVSGWCLAGGFELALWCDLRVATPSARFGFTERRFGVPLIDGGTQRLPRIVGSGRALDLVISGRVIDVEEADRFGLVTETVAAGARVERALAMAEAIAAFPQDTMLSDRRAVLEGAGLPLVQGLALEARLGRGRHATALEGAARFAAGEGRGAEGSGI